MSIPKTIKTMMPLCFLSADRRRILHAISAGSLLGDV
jgi:hypothetical protein